MQRRSIESRERILKAAYELFSEKGYYKTNTKEIGKRAGVSTGNVYNYFKDKKEIYLELAEQYCQGSIKATTNLFELIDGKSKEEARTLLKKYMDTQLVRAVEAGRFFDDAEIIAKEAEELLHKMEDSEAKVTEIIEKFIRHQIKTNPPVSYEVMARMLYVTVNEVSMDIMKTTDEKFRQEYIQTLLDFIINYVY